MQTSEWKVAQINKKYRPVETIKAQRWFKWEKVLPHRSYLSSHWRSHTLKGWFLLENSDKLKKDIIIFKITFIIIFVSAKINDFCLIIEHFNNDYYNSKAVII